jgi:hypothetical protein
VLSCVSCVACVFPSAVDPLLSTASPCHVPPPIGILQTLIGILEGPTQALLPSSQNSSPIQTSTAKGSNIGAEFDLARTKIEVNQHKKINPSSQLNQHGRYVLLIPSSLRPCPGEIMYGYHCAIDSDMLSGCRIPLSELQPHKNCISLFMLDQLHSRTYCTQSAFLSWM